MEHLSIVKRWRMAKSQHTVELNRLSEGLQKISKDIEDECGQSVRDVTFNIGYFTVYINLQLGRTNNNNNGTLSSLYNQTSHWDIRISDIEERVRLLKEITIEQVRQAAELTLSN